MVTLGKRQRAYIEALISDTCDAESAEEQRLLEGLERKGLVKHRRLRTGKFDLTDEGAALRDAAQTCPGCGNRVWPMSKCEICSERAQN